MPRSRSVFALLSSSVVVSAALVACNSDGRELRPANPTQNQSVYTPTTTTTPPTTIDPVLGTKAGTVSTSTALPVAVVGPLDLRLPFADGGSIDEAYTCNGADVHPEISWTGTPVDAVEMAIIVTDTDFDGFVHWVIAGLDPVDTVLGEGDVPVGAIEGVNDTSTAATPSIGWAGPCPPAGTTHHYQFALYALGQQVELPTASPSAELVSLIQATAIESVAASGAYTAPAG